MITPDVSLSNLLRRIALAPNSRVLNEAFSSFHSSFQNGIPFAEIKMTQELTQRILLANARVRRMENSSKPLQELMQRLREYLHQSLRINPLLSSHLQNMMGDAALESSCIDNFMSAVEMSSKSVSFSDLFFLLGSEWGGLKGHSIYVAETDYIESARIFYFLVEAAASLNAGTQSSLWRKCGLSSEGSNLSNKLLMAKEGGLSPPTAADLEQLKASGQTLYIPIGYANEKVFFISILAIDYYKDSYRLRLLSADNTLIHAAGEKLDHYCPEVIWEGLLIDQLTQSSLWKPLLEAATLTEKEQKLIEKNREMGSFLAFDSTHLVPWLIRRLGKKPRVRHVEIAEEYWTRILDEKFKNSTGIFKSFNDSPANHNQKDLLLKPTGKEIKRTLYSETLCKFVNLLPLDLIPSEKDRLLFKAESRLLLLTGAYMTLLKEESAPPLRGKFFRLIEQACGKVTAPIEKFMLLNPSEEQRNSARIILVSILDLKHRLADLVHSRDHIQLSAPRPLYPSTYTAHRLKLSGVSHLPIKHTLLDTMRLNQGELPLPFYDKWTAECFPEIHKSLSKWYDLLLDAKRKCEPVEIITFAHRNIFSRLPIPSTDRVEDIFPDQLSEGLLVGALLLLKKISSLVASEVYSEALVPPIFVADMARVYRFSIELYRLINPAVRNLPVSWFCLYQYLESRNSFHIPGEVKGTLDTITASFKLISPKGHLRPSDDFREIPLFYMSWSKLPLNYTFHRQSLGPMRYQDNSVEEVLSRAELADGVGLKPEETTYDFSASSVLWENSFGGQCVLILEEIAQYHIMSIFATTEAHQNALTNRAYREYHLFESLGPENHFQLEPSSWRDTFVSEYSNNFGGSDTKYHAQVNAGKTPMTHRMVCLYDKQLREPISDIPVMRVDEWREQADLIKAIPKRINLKGITQLHQAASGPSTLSMDVLLEYFEARPALLLNLDYRSYFLAIISSANVLETACTNEPLILERLILFINELYHEDRRKLAESNLNFERMLWLSALTRHLCRLNISTKKKFSPLLGTIVQELCKFGRGNPSESRLAFYVLASQQFLSHDSKLSLPELARLHLLIGRNPPTDPNDMFVWIEATEAMQTKAPEIQEALIKGDETTRRALWSLILSSESDVAKALALLPSKLSLSELAKSSAQMERLQLKQAYLQRWSNYWKKYHSREATWRESATTILLKKVDENIINAAAFVNTEAASLHKTANELLLFTKTTLLIQIGGRMISVDWETGRITGESHLFTSQAETSKTTGTRLPIYLRKHPNLAPLKELLLRKNIIRSPNGIVHIREFPALSLNPFLGEATLNHNGYSYRLVSPSQIHFIELPDQLKERFSVWLSENDNNELHGLLVAHSKDGTPHPALVIDRNGVIHPLKGNTRLRLASAEYFPEAELFARWGIEQKHILVWIDDDDNVAELYLPLNVEGHYTRVKRTENGTWKIEGLELQLEETIETVPAFAGHPVYLVAKNSEGQRLLLLPGATPYEIQNRKRFQYHAVDWNQIIASKPKESIHQYRIHPSGQVEGLTVADNLLLMLWNVYMGRYSTAVELAKRWLTPPGRPYTPDEERILSTWVYAKFGGSPMQMEGHPSALSLRLYVIVRMTRHLRNFPSTGKEKKKMSKLASKLLGESFETRQVRFDIDEHLMGKGTLGRQLRGTKFQELLSIYDHEAAIRLLSDKDRNQNRPLIRHLYQRQIQNQTDHEFGSTRVECKIHGDEIYDNHPEWNKYTFDGLVSSYPTTAQINFVPIETITRSLVPADLNKFFDKAYTLIKSGPSNPGEEKEYKAILHALQELRGPKLLDLCTQYYSTEINHFFEDIFYQNLLLWLILEQAYLAKETGKELPNLPSIQRRFGLALQGSSDLSKDFFTTLIDFSGMKVEELIQNYRQEWFKKLGMRYLLQNTVHITPPDSFLATLKTQWPSGLTSEIKRWSQLSPFLHPIERTEAGVSLSAWSYPQPEEWKGLSLPELQPKLLERLDFLLIEKTKRQKELLALANTLPTDENKKLHEFARQIHYAEPLTIDECISMALSGESKLQLTALLYLEASLEADHLQRAKEELNLCLNKLDDERTHKFLEDLWTPHHYLPNTSTLPLMITEYYSNCRLRTKPDQAQLINVLTAVSFTNKGSIIQAIMGSGKSKMIAPVWLQIMLNKGYIPILAIPSSLLRTTISDLQEMMWKRHRSHVRALTFDRESCTSDALHNLAETLYISMHEPTVFVCAIRDLHALQLMLKERHQVIEDMRERLKQFTLSWSRSCLKDEEQKLFSAALSDNNWDKAAEVIPLSHMEQFDQWYASQTKLEAELKPVMEETTLLQAILNLLQNQAALLTDEVATSYDPRNLLSFPIGWQTQANPQAAAIGCKLYFEWLSPYYEELNLMNNMQSLSKESTRQNIYRAISKKAWEEYRELLPNIPLLKIFTAYMMSDCEMGRSMQDYVYKLNENQSIVMKQLAQELAYLKYCLTSGLEGALTMTGHVSYGRSKQDPSLYLAIPYQCANVPKENTLFRLPWKTILMTCQYYSQGWNDPEQTAELIGFLQGIDPASKDHSIFEAATRIWGRRFTDVDFSNRKEIQELTKELDSARLHPDKAPAARLLISCYLNSSVFPTQLKIDPSQLTSSPQDIPMMAAKADGMGGTFGFESTWNPKLKRLPDHSSDASILKALAEPRNQTCHILPKGGAEAFLSHLEKGVLDGYMALIDAGAHLKGLSNETVANRLLHGLKEFDCVLFYDEQPSGGARLAVMSKVGKTLLESSDKERINRALSQMKLSNPFTFYDQARRIGADLELKDGRAMVTFSDAVTQDDLLQSCMRCRRLLDGRHTVAFAIPKEMDGVWDGNKVIETSKQQQILAEGKANFHGICEQLRGEVRAKIDREIRSSEDFEKRHHIYKAASSFLVEEQSNDLVKAFGSLKGMMRSSKTLQLLIEYLVARVEKILPDSKESIKKSLEAILQWHGERGTNLPEFVREGDTQDDAVQEVDLSKDQDRMRLMEEEYERMLGTRNPKKEVSWSSFDPKLIKPSPLGTYTNHEGMPTLYSLKEALKERGFSVPFSKNLLISANLLSTFLGEANCLLTENQKPVHRALFVRGVDKSTLVLVSEGDARYLKEHLLKMSDQQRTSIYLVESSGAINQRGSRSEKIVNLWREGTPQAHSLLLQFLIFQGSALLLDKLPVDEVTAALHLWTKKQTDRLRAVRILFEAALDQKPDDMLHYRRNQKLKALFI